MIWYPAQTAKTTAPAPRPASKPPSARSRCAARIAAGLPAAEQVDVPFFRDRVAGVDPHDLGGDAAQFGAPPENQHVAPVAVRAEEVRR